MDELRKFYDTYGATLVEYAAAQPLWVRLSAGAVCLGVLYWRRCYPALNGL